MNWPAIATIVTGVTGLIGLVIGAVVTGRSNVRNHATAIRNSAVNEFDTLLEHQSTYIEQLQKKIDSQISYIKELENQVDALRDEVYEADKVKRENANAIYILERRIGQLITEVEALQREKDRVEKSNQELRKKLNQLREQ